MEGFERYGDASSGPLQVGDRGIVVDVQRGPNGEKYVTLYFYCGSRTILFLTVSSFFLFF